MIYVALDVETTGLNPDENQLIQLGAIIEDTNKKLSWDEIPKFNYFVKHDSYYFTREYPLILNKWIFDKLHDNKFDEDVIHISNLSRIFYKWLLKYINPEKDGKVIINIAGKNPQFDKSFVEIVPEIEKFISINRRLLDPSMYYIDFKNDEKVPSLKECKKRHELGEHVTHNALIDSWNVIELMRKAY